VPPTLQGTVQEDYTEEVDTKGIFLVKIVITWKVLPYLWRIIELNCIKELIPVLETEERVESAQQPAPLPAQQPPASNDLQSDRTLALVSHLVLLFPLIGSIGAIALYFINKEKSAFLVSHLKQAAGVGAFFLAGQIFFNVLGYIPVLGAVVAILGYPVYLIVGIIFLIGIIKGAIRANKGEAHQYSLIGKFVANLQV
jgi:uncharacterized membrane protein